jgi:ABC-2 type transport system ATP-binding protein
MIEIKNLSHTLGNKAVLKDIDLVLSDNKIFGLVGVNGAGKSTLLRCMSAVYTPDSGSVEYDGLNVNNENVRKDIFFLPDDPYHSLQLTCKSMFNMYKVFYPDADVDTYKRLIREFNLDEKKTLNTFSKGMKRQAATILALSAMPKYLFFDETFDGLDPVMRNLVKQVIYNDVLERGTTTIITSHSLRELEDTCDQLALLHKGGIVFESDIQNLKTSLFKVQIAFGDEYNRERFEGIEILNYRQLGSVADIIVRGDKEEIVAKLKALSPLIIDVLPLNLEEVFIYEMEALGYAFKDIL